MALGGLMAEPTATRRLSNEHAAVLSPSLIAASPDRRGGKDAISEAGRGTRERMHAVSSRGRFPRFLRTSALAAPWLTTFALVVFIGPELEDFNQTGLALTKAEVKWIAVCVLVASLIGRVAIIHRFAGSTARCDAAHTMLKNAKRTQPNDRHHIATSLGRSPLRAGHLRAAWSAIIRTRKEGHGCCLLTAPHWEYLGKSLPTGTQSTHRSPLPIRITSNSGSTGGVTQRSRRVALDALVISVGLTLPGGHFGASHLEVSPSYAR
jgi:hypothetical protein